MDTHTSAQKPHALLVDDEKSSRDLGKIMLERCGCKVTSVEGAGTAKALIEQGGSSRFDLVVSDYWMPGESGLELMKSITQEDSTLSVVLMTADGEREILETLILNGGCGYIHKPLVLEAVRERVERAIERTRHMRELREMQIEANKVADNQRALLERQLALRWPDIELFFISKSQASGDFVSAVELSDNRKILLASDGSGHELSSAFQSTYFHGLARGMLEREATIDEVFAYFNDALLAEWNSSDASMQSLATCALIMDLESKTLEIANAGFPRPFHSNPDGFASALGDEVGAPPLGWFLSEFPRSQAPLGPGRIYIWTDGLSDLAADQGIDPLALADRLLNKNFPHENLTSNAGDDIAVLRFEEKDENSPASFHYPLISVRISGDQLDNIDTWQAYCEKSLSIAQGPKTNPLLSDVLVCIREGLINALKHGCEARDDRFCELRVSRSPNGESYLVQIKDEGEGHEFDWEAHADKAAEALIPEHRGMIMMQTIPERTCVSENGTLILMEFRGEVGAN